MVFLAKNKNKISSLREISNKEGIPFDYLEKILTLLEKVSLVESKKGSRGGYLLAKSPQKIKIGEIIRPLEGEAGLVKCTRKGCNCLLENKCFAKKFWQKLQNSLNTALDSLTLAELIK
jgi:Rrf2 family protein